MGSNSSAAIPAITLPSSPAEGEVLLITTSGLIFENNSLAMINNNRIDTKALATPGSPYVTPLAESLEAAFKERLKDPDADTARWMVILPDGKVEYRALYSALYTSWERGSRLHLAATNPGNPHSYLAVEIFPSGWPDPLSVSVPDQFVQVDAELRPDKSAKEVILTIKNSGFTIRGPGEKPEEATLIQRDTTWPINQLRSRYEELAKGKNTFTALRIEPAADVRTFTLLRTISALQEPVGSLKPLKEIRLSPPVAR